MKALAQQRGRVEPTCFNRLGAASSALLVLVASTALPAPLARASPLFEVVGDAHGLAGQNARATGPGAASTYFNPALLPEAESGVMLGFFFLSQQIATHLDARASSPACPNRSCDIPVINNAGPEAFRHEDGSTIDTPALPTSWLENGRLGPENQIALPARPRQAAGSGQKRQAFIGLGLVEALIENRLSIGVYTQIPLDGFMQTRAFYGDEREQFFSNSLHPELYADRLSAASIAFGAGLRLSSQLSVGVALTLAIQSGARAPAYVSNLSDLDSLLLDSDVSVSVALAPHLALSYQPSSRLRLSATVHSPQGVEIDTKVSYIIATGLEQRTEQRFTHGYLPWIVAVGAEFGLDASQRPLWSLVATVTYSLWSQYRDRHDARPSPGFAWSNVAGASLGVRHRGQRFRGLLDAVFAPSPVPAQSGRSNYVDNDRAGAALGFAYAFAVDSHACELGLSAQAHRLLPRSVRKASGLHPELVRDELPDDAIGGTPRGPIAGREGLQTNNPGFPGFASDGFILGAGVHFALAF
jgi:long-chain fatty acid transport protein